MWRGAGQLLNWLACHLVALGFLTFLVLAVVFRDALFGLSTATVTVPRTPPAVVTGDNAAQPRQEVAAAERQEPVETSDRGADSAGDQPVSTAGFRPLTAEEREAARKPLGSGSLAGKTAPTGKSPSRLRPLDEDEIRLPADALLKRARTAFWDGRPEKAEALYLRYLQMRPDDANGFGELGNLYQSMGRTQDALDAYYEAGVRLRAEGDRKQLARVIEWLEKAGDPRAEILGRP